MIQQICRLGRYSSVILFRISAKGTGLLGPVVQSPAWYLVFVSCLEAIAAEMVLAIERTSNRLTQ
jgi:hypothetical protein